LLISGKFLVAINYSGNRVIKNVYTRKITFKYYASCILKNIPKLTAHVHAKEFLASYFSEVGEDIKIDLANHDLFKLHSIFWFIKIADVESCINLWRQDNSYKYNPLKRNMKTLLEHLNTNNKVLDTEVESIFNEFIKCVQIPMIEKLICCILFMLKDQSRNYYWFLGSEYDCVLNENLDSKYYDYYDKLIRNINFSYKDPFIDILKDATLVDMLILSTRFSSKLRNSMLYLLIKLPVVPIKSIIQCLGILESNGEKMLTDYNQKESLDFFNVISCKTPYFLNVHECLWNYVRGMYVSSTCSLYDEVCRVFAKYNTFEVVASHGKISDVLLNKMFEDLKPNDFYLKTSEEREDIQMEYANTINLLLKGIRDLHTNRLSNSVLKFKHKRLISWNDIQKMAPYGTDNIISCFLDLIYIGIIPLDISNDVFKFQAEGEINCALNDNENLIHTSEVNRMRIIFRMASKYQTESKKNKKIVIPAGKELLYAILESTNGINIRKLNLQKLFDDISLIKGEPNLLGLSYFEIISDQRLRKIIAEDILNVITTDSNVLNIYLLNLNMTCNYKFVSPKYIICK
jgi:hypothetical protein